VVTLVFVEDVIKYHFEHGNATDRLVCVKIASNTNNGQ